MKFLVAGIVAALSLVLVVSGNNNAGEKKAKYTISQVMQKAMKGGLCKKVASGKASDEEKKQLAEMFAALAQNTPPKGDAAEWKKKAGALAAVAKKIAGGDEKAVKALGKLANCGACHSVFKG